MDLNVKIFLNIEFASSSLALVLQHFTHKLFLAVFKTENAYIYVKSISY